MTLQEASDGGPTRILVVDDVADNVEILDARLSSRGYDVVTASTGYLPEAVSGPQPTFAELSKAIRPSEAETLRNPRARSATLRAAVRTAAPMREAA